MSRQWDPGSVPNDEHPYGDNTLDAYAKRQGALDSAHNERHLGLEDTHIMLVAMKHHLATLKAQGQGPWGPGGRSGVGGKPIVCWSIEAFERCGRVSDIVVVVNLNMYFHGIRSGPAFDRLVNRFLFDITDIFCIRCRKIFCE